MGNSTSEIKKANFDDIINIIKDSAKKTRVLIHVMDAENQELLIKGTLSINEEIEKMNSLLHSGKMDATIEVFY